MGQLANRYGAILLVRGALILLCALAVPKLASSETDIAPIQSLT
jgi:hypothetical protein